MLHDHPAAHRQVRVFVSSTFRDMQEDRDHLVKFVFPELRKLCESRAVAWGEVDLRWGIPDERTAEGQVLPICLEEIARCRPYFIALLGERYGWVPDAVPADLVARERWLSDYGHASVTELEIVHGVLRDPALADHAFFYFRDPAFVETLSPDRRRDFVEEDPERRARLRRLKDRIRASGCPVRENYADAQALGALVRTDLGGVVDGLFPACEPLDPLDREAADQEAFVRSRTRVYVPRRDDFDRLDAHAAGDGPPLVVEAESGGGKSALLANWVARRPKTRADERIITHFIGSTSQSTDWAAMLRRVIGELNRALALGVEIPGKRGEIGPTFAHALYAADAALAAGSNGPLSRVIIVIDALNQLEDQEGAGHLIWLPPVVPGRVRLIVSALPGSALDEMHERGWPTLVVEPLRPAERRSLMDEYLAQYSKELGGARAARLGDAPQGSNPLYLTSLLEELRVFGQHESLDDRIASYLEARSAPELFGKILRRWEEDYDVEHKGLVQDAMSLLWAGRHGLAEAEVWDMLGRDGQPLPRAAWSPLYLAAEASLVNRSGVLGFAHEHFRRAVEDAYLPTAADRRAIHLRVAEYFETRSLNARQIVELPWQLAQAQSWQRLYEQLSHVSFLLAAWLTDASEVKAFWNAVETRSPLRMVDAYAPLLDSPGEHSDVAVSLVATLLAETSRFAEALSLQQFLIAHFRRTGDALSLSQCLGSQAAVLERRGDLGSAMDALGEQEALCRTLDYPLGLERAIGNQATILYLRGELAAALDRFNEQESLCRSLGVTRDLAVCIGNRANILFDLGELEQALATYREQERLCRACGDRSALAMSLDNQANVLREIGDLAAARSLNREATAIATEIGDRVVLQGCLGNSGLTARAQGDLEGALAAHETEERICREIGHIEGLQRSLGNRANIFRSMGDLDRAMALHKEEERICREMGNRDGLQRCLANQAVLLCDDKHDLDGAAPMLAEAVGLCRQLGYRGRLLGLLQASARTLKARSRDEELLPVLAELETLCREMRDWQTLHYCLGEQARLLTAAGDTDAALRKYKEQARVRREFALGGR